MAPAANVPVRVALLTDGMGFLVLVMVPTAVAFPMSPPPLAVTLAWIFVVREVNAAASLVAAFILLSALAACSVGTVIVYLTTRARRLDASTFTWSGSTPTSAAIVLWTAAVISFVNLVALLKLSLPTISVFCKPDPPHLE